jgi:hypothetical protein
MSSQTIVGSGVQQGVQLFADKKEVVGKSKAGAIAVAEIESVAANEPDEFEIRRREFFTVTKHAS